MTARPPTPFVLLASARTGSSLLLGMLESHPRMLAGKELFNGRAIDEGFLGWPARNDTEAEELRQLRAADPVRFLDRLYDDAAERGAGAVGFKLMYDHARNRPTVVERLVKDPGIRLIHLKRRNLLERYLSEERARRTDSWFRVRPDAPPPPVIDLDLKALVQNLITIESAQREFEQAFAGHPLLEVWYEDLAAEPVAVGRRAAEFLGLDPQFEPALKFHKSGTQPLDESISNYGELRDTFARWRSFFEA